MQRQYEFLRTCRCVTIRENVEAGKAGGRDQPATTKTLPVDRMYVMYVIWALQIQVLFENENFGGVKDYLSLRQAEIKYRAKIVRTLHVLLVVEYVQLSRNFYVPVVRTASMNERKLP